MNPLTDQGCIRLLACLLLAAVANGGLAQTGAARANDNFRDKLVSLGTASESGTFYQVGRKLCELVNRDRRDKILRCIAYRSAGSEYNIKAVQMGDLTIGMTRSDSAYNEFKNHARESDINGDALRAVMSLHAMPVMVIARRASNITSIDQLAGHAINLGNRGSGQRTIVELLLKSLQLSEDDFSLVTEFNTQEMGAAFCAGEVDIIVEALGNPSPFYERMIDECDGRIVGMPAAFIEKVVAANPMIEKQTIAGGLYDGHPSATPTFGYRAILVASKGTDAESVRRFIASIMGRLPELKGAITALRDLDPDTMFNEGIAIPLHDGVALYRGTSTSKAHHVTHDNAKK